MNRTVAQIGQRFGRWVILERSANNKSGKSKWLCRCDCGTVRAVAWRALKEGVSASCGCLMRDKRTTHGESRSITYHSWVQMIRRCYDQKATAYSLYGARGITVNQEWHDFSNFLRDLGPRPSPEHSLDRYPNHTGNYEPGNVRWATWSEQAMNKRTTMWMIFHGQKKTVKEWSKIFGVSYATLRSRVSFKGWTVEESLLTPVGFPRGCGYEKEKSPEEMSEYLKSWPKMHGHPAGVKPKY